VTKFVDTIEFNLILILTVYMFFIGLIMYLVSVLDYERYLIMKLYSYELEMDMELKRLNYKAI
jgi:hypothetical protein